MFVETDLTISNTSGNPLDDITSLVLFHTVSALILSRNSCPSHVSLPTPNEYILLDA